MREQLVKIIIEEYVQAGKNDTVPSIYYELESNYITDVICLEFASRIGFDRKVSCLTYFNLTRFPTAKVSFKLDLKLVRDILTLPLKLQ